MWLLALKIESDVSRSDHKALLHQGFAFDFGKEGSLGLATSHDCRAVLQKVSDSHFTSHVSPVWADDPDDSAGSAMQVAMRGKRAEGATGFCMALKYQLQA